jgi:UDP-2,4-diacetamido-2,4,6-trideoxy-beta-L-altropyranose hydrolase
VGNDRPLTFAFLCDGNAAVGLGHASRCLGLAEALADRGARCAFAGRYDATGSRLITGAGFRIEAASAAERADGLVVDSYDIDAAGLERLATTPPGRSLTVIDDFGGLLRYPAGALIVNFSLAANAARYDGDDLTVLRGPGYLLVRRAVAAQHGRVPREPPHHALVAIGGFDRTGLGPAAAAQLAAAGIEVDTVAGGERPHLADAYALADLCVTGGGMTKYEAAFVGLPVAVLSQTPEEDEDTRQLASAGLCADLGYAPTDPELRARLSDFLDDATGRAAMRDAARAIFRPDSANRVAAAMLAHTGASASRI